MARWRISRDRPEWAIVPELAWTVSEWDSVENCWVAVRKFSTWRTAADYLIEAWPVLEPETA